MAKWEKACFISKSHITIKQLASVGNQKTSRTRWLYSVLPKILPFDWCKTIKYILTVIFSVMILCDQLVPSKFRWSLTRLYGVIRQKSTIRSSPSLKRQISIEMLIGRFIFLWRCSYKGSQMYEHIHMHAEINIAYIILCTKVCTLLSSHIISYSLSLIPS